MDISNATAAGPSYGLFDVIFGQAPKEANEADGQEFMPLMNLIKAMKDKNQETENSNRTDEEIAPGKAAVDYRSVGMPGWYPNLMMTQPPQGGVEGLSEEAKPLTAQSFLENKKVDPNQVNRMLSEKSLPPLSAQEMQLLGDVNTKIATLMKEKAADSKIPGLNPSMEAIPADSDSMAAPEKSQPLLKELARAGVDPRLLRGAENEAAPQASAAPEKFLSTEAYMQMHERFTKGQPKEESLAAKRLQVEDMPNHVSAKDAKMLEQVLETSPKEKDLFGKTERDLPDLLRPEKSAPRDLGLSFESSLHQSLKGEMGTRDIVVPGTKPEEMRDVLLGEVNHSVNFHALKGGGEMRLVIHPDELGEVKLQIGTKNGKVEVQVTAENEEVAKLIRGGSQQLESSLRDQNLALAKFDVTVVDSPVASLDTKSNLSEQFLPQQQNSGFSQTNSGNENGFSRWDGNANQRQSSGPDVMIMEEQKGSAAVASKSPGKILARDYSRRLDVVA